MARIASVAAVAAAWACLSLRVAVAAPGPWPAAEAAIASQHWDEARVQLQAQLAAHPDDALAESLLAQALLHLKRVGEAKTHLERAEAIGLPGGHLAYRRAQWLAATGDTEGALRYLGQALDRGLGPRVQPATDPLLAPLRGQPGFTAFVERFAREVTPCRADPRYRQLDYWLGTWDVRPRGARLDTPASENVLSLEYDGCVVQEHWRGLGGVTGSSFNLYDATRDAWVQVWVDSSGGLHEYRGHLDADGHMRFEGETPGGPGQPKRVRTRLTIFHLGPDEVRQFSESSADGGQTWTVNYDLIYRRRGSPAAGG
jgi:hypothetical protein